MIWLYLTLFGLAPCLGCLSFHFISKLSFFKNISFGLKQVIYGLFFAAIAIMCNEFSFKDVSTGGTANIGFLSVLICGLFCGSPAGLLAGIVAGVERALSSLWGIGTLTVLSDTINLVLVAIIGGGLRHILFKGKCPTPIFAFFLGETCEVFHMFITFLTLLDDVKGAFLIMKSFSIPTFIISGTVLLLASYIINRLEKRSLKILKKDITTIFQRRLFLITSLIFVFSSALTVGIEISFTTQENRKLLNQNMQDIKDDVDKACDKSLLVTVEEVSDYLYQDELLLNFIFDEENENFYSKLPKCQEFISNYSTALSEINFINKDGIIIASNDERYVYFDMYNQENQQSKDFMALFDETISLTDPVVQEYQPISDDETKLRKYAGIRLDHRGYLQIGLGPTLFQQQIRKEASQFTNYRHIGNTGYIIVVDSDGEVVSSLNGEFEGQSFFDIYEDFMFFEPSKDYAKIKILDEEVVCCSMSSEGYYIFCCLPIQEANMSRDITIYITISLLILGFTGLFTIVYWLIDKNVIKDIKKIGDSLSKISEGNLDISLNVNSNKEFALLSDDINKTVSTLKSYIKEAEGRIDKELEFAHSIQTSSLPNIFPPFPNRHDLDIFASMSPAKEVGGDLYDFYFVGKDRLVLLIGDVSGKGIPSAMFMMRCKSLIKGFLESGKDVDEVFYNTNNILCENNDKMMFVTAWLGIIDLSSGILDFVNAGHNAPLIKLGKTYQYLKTAPGFVLGGLNNYNYKKNTITLNAGDSIFLYTDGVVEAQNLTKEFYTEQRLQHLLNSKLDVDADSLVKAVKESLDDFVKDEPQFDDITMLSFMYKGAILMKEMKVDALLENLDIVTDFINENLNSYECQAKAIAQINIAIDELFSNISRYAYHPEIGQATIRVEVIQDPLSVIISFIDNGVPFDPLQVLEPDVTLEVDQRPIGGLGIFLVKKTMDSVSYEYRNGQNILTIKKNLD